ncbi:MAG: hypothetical protein Q3M24_08380 [Candidatus Electrothrix aestuarii]|uniref:Uncharacterized protein n=1 Tax=Candidatus Electrothrix aestuarii TaxID=3062594 RepID=A0AAU8M0I0_9BACT|nr:hypothetical protein [Candidatus Electrothrix aestuarii]
MSIQCKPVPNALTTPSTYILRFVPRDTADEQNLAADIHRYQPNFSPEAVETILQAENETLRIQALQDARQHLLLFSLLDMHEGGQTGPAVSVSAEGDQTLQGFRGSAVSSLTVPVNDYASLKELIRNSYGGRLVDVLEVKVDS